MLALTTALPAALPALAQDAGAPVDLGAIGAAPAPATPAATDAGTPDVAAPDTAADSATDTADATDTGASATGAAPAATGSSDTAGPGTADAVDLGTVTFGIAGAEPVDGRADPLTLTGLKTAVPITEVPQSVSVVSAEEIAAENAPKLDYALRGTAGVQAAPYAFDNDTNWFFSRGFDMTQTGVFLDGLQLRGYGFGSIYVDPFLVERVEVLRGPSAMLYGSSNAGGVLNYVSRLPDGRERSELTLGVDSEGRALATVDVGGTSDGGTAYRFGAKLQRVDGHGAFDDGIEGIVSAGLGFDLGEAGRLTLTGSHTEMKEDHAGGAWLPYFGTEAPTDAFGTFDYAEFNVGLPDVDDYDRSQTLLGANWTRDFGAWTVTDNARLARAHVQEDSVISFGYAGFSTTPTDAAGTLASYRFAHDSEVWSFHNDLRAERQFISGGTTHDVLLGTEIKHWELDQRQGGAFLAQGVSVTDPDRSLSAPALTAESYYADDERELDQFGVYAQDQIRWGDGWIATLNGRIDTAHARKRDTGSGDVIERDDTEATGRVALSKRIGDFTPYAVAGTYFAPDVELDADTQAETGRQYELGVKWSPTETTLLTFAAFDIKREDVTTSRTSENGLEVITIGEARSRGIEFEAQAQVTPELRLSGSLTAMDVDQNDATAYLPVVEDLASLSVEYRPEAMPALTLRGGLTYTGESFADQNETLQVDGVTLLDAGARYDFADGWAANLAVSNLTDETYIRSCQSATSCYAGEGRVASLTISRRF